MKNVEKILILGGVGYGLYYAITKLTGKGTTEESPVEEEKAILPKTSRTYEEKVGELQGLLGASIDGKAGKQTNGMLENLYTTPPMSVNFENSFKQGYPFLTKYGKGVVSQSNIDFYLSALRNKTYPNAKFYASSDATRESRLIYNAYDTKGVLKTKKESSFEVVSYDAARKIYVSTGKKLNYKANASFIVPESLSRPRVKIKNDFPSGWLIVDINPINESPYTLKINPYNVFVQF